MSDFGATPTSNATLNGTTTDIPTSGAYVPGTAGQVLTAPEGIAVNTDAAGKKSTAQRFGLLDGDDVTQGAKADAAVTGDNPGTNAAKLRGLSKIFTAVSDLVNNLLHTNLKQVGGTTTDTNSGNKSAGTLRVVIATDQPTLANAQPVSGTVAVSNFPGTQAVSETNSAAIKTDLDTMVPGVQGWIAATGTGTANADDAITFAQQVRKVVLYNASANPVPIEFDQVAAATSFPLLPGSALVMDNILCTAVHVFPSVTLPINTTAGLYVKGWK